MCNLQCSSCRTHDLCPGGWTHCTKIEPWRVSQFTDDNDDDIASDEVRNNPIYVAICNEVL